MSIYHQLSERDNETKAPRRHKKKKKATELSNRMECRNGSAPSNPMNRRMVPVHQAREATTCKQDVTFHFSLKREKKLVPVVFWLVCRAGPWFIAPARKTHTAGMIHTASTIHTGGVSTRSEQQYNTLATPNLAAAALPRPPLSPGCWGGLAGGVPGGPRPRRPAGVTFWRDLASLRAKTSVA